MTKIEINGKEYPCRVTMGAMLRFKRETGHDVSKMDPTDVAELVTLLWCCIVSASKADGVEFRDKYRIRIYNYSDREWADHLAGGGFPGDP